MSAEFKELNDLAKALSPSERKKLARRLGMTMRRNATQRIKRNIDPDGDAHVARKPQKYGKNKKKMFQQLSKARRLKLTVSTNRVVMTYKNGLDAYIAGVHQKGEKAKVNKTTHVKYPVRMLFGFSKKDMDALEKDFIDHLGF